MSAAGGDVSSAGTPPQSSRLHDELSLLAIGAGLVISALAAEPAAAGTVLGRTS